MIKSKYKKCPRCGFKTFKDMQNCGSCGLNYKKLELATNKEGIKALTNGEKDRVVWTKTLPIDINKWRLFFFTLFLFWTGAHLYKVGRFGRAIAHSVGLVLGAIYIIILQFPENAYTYNIGNFFGVFWVITLSLAFLDIFEIAFGWFKVPVSLPYKD